VKGGQFLNDDASRGVRRLRMLKGLWHLKGGEMDRMGGGGVL